MQAQKGRGRGFASMSQEKKREIASKGGKAAHAMGTAHKWTSEEAQAAGRKGGSISRRRPLLPAFFVCAGFGSINKITSP